MNAIIIFLIILMVFSYWRYLSRKLAIAKFKTALYALHDDTHDLIDCHRITKSEGEKLLDTIEVAIRYHHFISIFSLNISITQGMKRRKLVTKNHELSVLYDRLDEIVVNYVVDQYKLTFELYSRLRPILKPYLPSFAFLSSITYANANPIPPKTSSIEK